MAATALPPFDLAPLSRFLAEASGARGVEITTCELLPGGAIQENWGIDAEFAGGGLAGPQWLVLRTDAATGIPSSLPRIDEFAILKAAFAAGVTVPEPLFAGADSGIIGKPFFVMRQVAGTAQGRQISADPVFEPALPRIAVRLGEELARLQTIRPPRPDLGFLAPPEANSPAEEIAGFRAYLDRHPNPRPVLEWAIRWLETHIPPPLGPVLCHRDFRTGNYMLDIGSEGAELTGILDWEFAGWGDPDEDIGWFCCKGWRFARLDREAGGIAERAPFYAGYERAAGRRLDPDRVRFWEIFANVRWAIIALQQTDRYRLGGARDLSTAIIGRRAGESELELMMLLDPAGPEREETPSPPPGERVGVRGQPAESQPARPHPTLPRKRGRNKTGGSPPSPALRERGSCRCVTCRPALSLPSSADAYCWTSCCRSCRRSATATCISSRPRSPSPPARPRPAMARRARLSASWAGFTRASRSPTTRRIGCPAASPSICATEPSKRPPRRKARPARYYGG
jgi:aminoglycoside phosphotransferase (APT) family kinase protein